jgi:hypothetical protein
VSNEPNKLNTPRAKFDDEHFMTFDEVSTSCSCVLAGCHSLVVYDEEETTGDPLEISHECRTVAYFYGKADRQYHHTWVWSPDLRGCHSADIILAQNCSG